MDTVIRFDTSHIDYDGLETDGDFREAAQSVLPEYIKNKCEASAQLTWNSSKGNFRALGITKQQFIRERAKDFRKSLGDNEKQEWRDEVIDLLRAQKAERAPKPR